MKDKHRNKLNKTEKKLIHSVREIPFLSVPNHDHIDKIIEMAGDTSTVIEMNTVALQLYENVEIIGKQALQILIAVPAPPPADLSGR